MAEITVAGQVPAAHHQHDTHEELSIANQKLGMWLYLASEIVIFSILIGGYVIYRINAPASVRLIQDTLGVTLVTINTFILLASSYAMVMGLRGMEMGNRAQFQFWIGLTALMGALFIGGQYIEYSELRELGITFEKTDFNVATPIFEETVEVDVILADGTTVHLHEFEAMAAEEAPEVAAYFIDFLNPAAFNALELDTVTVSSEGSEVALNTLFSQGDALLQPEQFEAFNAHFNDTLARGVSNFGMRFYAPTAFHGLHVLVGVFWALLVLRRGIVGRYDSNAIGVEIFGLYWHFVDVVWILLFTLIYLI